jgi:hypothetical protein
MHLEGKLHTGYMKIRKALTEMKVKREEFKRLKERERKDGKRRSRSRSIPKHNNSISKELQKEIEKQNDPFYFSSRVRGSGVNVPSSDEQKRRFADIAVYYNNTSVGEKMTDITKLGKEWGYYKRDIEKKKKEEEMKADGGRGRPDNRHRENNNRGFGERR